MATNQYEVGDTITLTATCKNNAVPPALYDPATVVCKVSDDGGTVTTTSLAAGTVTRVSTGVYTSAFAPTLPGTHTYEFVTPVRAVSNTFYVKYTPFS